MYSKRLYLQYVNNTFINKIQTIMKKNILSLMLIALTAGFTFSSCGNDNDEPAPKEQTTELAKPKYADKALKIKDLTPNTLNWNSIEFTESGLFIARIKDTRAEGEKIISGAYVIGSNGTYSVTSPEFNGSIKVDGNKITVTTPSGDQTVEGTKVAAIDNSENEKLCRTWIIEDRFKVDGLATKLSDRKEFDKTGRPTEFTLTKSGTFYVKFAGGSSEAGDWNWKVTGTSFNIADIVSYAFSNFAIEYGKLVTIRFSIDGSNYEGYLTEKI